MKVQSMLYSLLLVSLLWAVEKNPKIELLVTDVSGDSIWELVDTLATFERFTTETESYQCTEYLQSYLQQFGYDEVYQQEFKDAHTPNIIAVKKGKVEPDSHLLICAHYDSYAPASPGADDNASGTASLMEIARVISESEFEKSIVLAFFSGEEIGLLGSQYYANKAALGNMQIESMINLDVIGYLKPGTDLAFDCSYNTESKPLYDTLTALVPLYIPEVSIVDASKKMFASSSDHRSFWNNGYTGLFFAEELDRYSPDFNNYWHSDNDILGLSCNSKELMTAVSQATIAFTAHKAGIVKQENIAQTIEQASQYEFSIVGQNLYVSNCNTPKGTISIYSMRGQKLVEQAINQTNNLITIPLQALSTGMYVARLTTSSNTYNFRFVR